MTNLLRFHALRWIRTNVGSISGYEVEEFIDSTRTYTKTVWADGYTEVTQLFNLQTGQEAKKPRSLSNLSVYKSPKLYYNK